MASVSGKGIGSDLSSFSFKYTQIQKYSHEITQRKSIRTDVIDFMNLERLLNASRVLILECSKGAFSVETKSDIHEISGDASGAKGPRKGNVLDGEGKIGERFWERAEFFILIEVVYIFPRRLYGVAIFSD
jgi:hypothetical protein